MGVGGCKEEAEAVKWREREAETEAPLDLAPLKVVASQLLRVVCGMWCGGVGEVGMRWKGWSRLWNRPTPTICYSQTSILVLHIVSFLCIPHL